MDRYNLRVLHWNARGLSKKAALLRPLLQEQNIDVALISETFLEPAIKLKFPGYLAYRQDERSDTGIAYRGLVVLIKRRVVHQPIPSISLSSMSALGVEISIAGTGTRIFAAYKPPQVKLQPADIHSLLDSPLPTIIAGDLNCKHAAWNSIAPNRNGKILLDDSESQGYTVSGPDVPTHYPEHASYRADILDIIIHKGLHYQPQQEVLLDELGSDHQPVLAVLAAPAARSTPPVPRPRIDWTTFTEEMDRSTPTRPVITAEDVDTLAEELTARIQEALEHAKTPRPRGKLQVLPRRIREMILAKRRMRKRWQETRCPLLKSRLNALKDKVKAELDSHNTDSWEKVVEAAGEDWAAMHRLCRQLSNAPTPIRPLLHGDGTPRYRAADRAEIFAKHLERQFQPNPTANAQHTAIVEQNLEIYLAPPVAPEEDPTVITPGMVQRAIRKTKPRKAPGADGITNAALRHLPYRTVAAITRLYNGILRSGRFPDKWKTGHVIMLPKPGKNILKPESYRPITLLPTISKVFEALLLRYLLPHITPRREQFGFRAEHSTTLQLSRVLHSMTVASNKKEFTVAVFLDMEKAFDRVWHAGLLHKLSSTDAPRRLVKVVASFLKNRKFQVVVEDTVSEEHSITAGVPQGSCLSPCLYSHFTDDIPLVEGSQLALYADDAAYFAASYNRRFAAAKVQKALNLLPEWLSRWRLSVNVGKTQAIMIGNYVKLPPPLILAGQEIKWSQVAKYLGIIIDPKLSMRPHVKEVVGKTRAARAQLHPVLNSPRIPLRVKLGVFKTYIRSRLTYAAPAWYALTSEDTKKRLRAQQHLTLRKITNAPRLVRNSTIQRDLRIESLDAFISRLAKKMFERADKSKLDHIRDLAPLHARPPDHKALPRELITCTPDDA